jgi:hypothetical protein
MNAEAYAPGSTGNPGLRVKPPETLGEAGAFVGASLAIAAIPLTAIAAVEVGPVVVGAALTHPVETVIITETAVYTGVGYPGPSAIPHPSLPSAPAVASEVRLVQQEVRAAEQLAAESGGQQLFRVVNNAERAGIESSGKFTFPVSGSTPTGQPGKFFWGCLDEAKQFQQMWYRGGEQSYILQTTIGSEVKPWLGPALTDGIGQPIFVELPNLTAPINWVH